MNLSATRPCSSRSTNPATATSPPQQRGHIVCVAPTNTPSRLVATIIPVPSQPRVGGITPYLPIMVLTTSVGGYAASINDQRARKAPRRLSPGDRNLPPIESEVIEGTVRALRQVPPGDSSSPIPGTLAVGALPNLEGYPRVHPVTIALLFCLEYVVLAHWTFTRYGSCIPCHITPLLLISSGQDQ